MEICTGNDLNWWLDLKYIQCSNEHQNPKVIYFNYFRHSNKPTPVDRVNKYLNQAITARSVEREKSEHVNYITLRFKNSDKEKLVNRRYLYLDCYKHAYKKWLGEFPRQSGDVTDVDQTYCG